jgi:hypothetical protein
VNVTVCPTSAEIAFAVGFSTVGSERTVTEIELGNVL